MLVKHPKWYHSPLPMRVCQTLKPNTTSLNLFQDFRSTHQKLLDEIRQKMKRKNLLIAEKEPFPSLEIRFDPATLFPKSKEHADDHLQAPSQNEQVNRISDESGKWGTLLKMQTNTRECL